MSKIIFFGSEDFSLTSLKALVDNGFDVAAVVTKPDSPQGRGQKVMPSAIKLYAIEKGIDVWQPNKLSEITENVSALGKPAGVLVSYGKIIPQSIIDLFDPGIINIHPSLLPKYRGPAPVEAAILNGDKQTGISIMQLSKDMDAGPIYHQIKVDLNLSETGQLLLDKLGTIGASELIKVLPDILDGSLPPQPQNDADATYTKLIEKSDGIINWNKSATEIEQEIRAYHGWPQSRTTLGDIEVIILKAHVVHGSKTPGTIEHNNSQLLVGTDKDLLAIDILKPLGKKEMPVAAFLSGYRTRLN